MARKTNPVCAALSDAVDVSAIVHSSDEEPGIARQKRGRGWRYLRPDGKPVKDAATLQRIRKLAIPPAYSDVWICPDENGHIQATGRDARGRKQYRYHPLFREWRERVKYDRMLDFAETLPQIRDRVSRDMRRQGLPREKVLATVVRLLETTMIRVGNVQYARANKSYGLTTLRSRHVQVDEGELRFNFKGKSGKVWRLKLKDRRVARIVRAVQDLPGQHLFQYLDEHGDRHEVSSTDINAYLKEISGRDVTAKDFRTWTGTVIAAIALSEYEKFDSQAAAKRNIRAAIEVVAARLGNTPAICRKCYVHPEVFDAYLSEALTEATLEQVGEQLTEGLSDLDPEEAVVLAFLRDRLTRGGKPDKRRATSGEQRKRKALAAATG